jgi:hypothetical protein
VGDKFYGYIVTLQDAESTVLSQSATSGTLAKVALGPELEVKSERRDRDRDDVLRFKPRSRPVRRPRK